MSLTQLLGCWSISGPLRQTLIPESESDGSENL